MSTAAQIIAKLQPGPVLSYFTASLPKIGSILADAVDKEAPSKTGTLKKSISFRVSGQAIRVSVGAPYAPYVVSGTRPHVITAHGRALRFATSGGVAFAKSVNHPGTKPNDFLTRGRDKALPAVSFALQGAGIQWAESVGR